MNVDRILGLFSVQGRARPLREPSSTPRRVVVEPRPTVGATPSPAAAPVSPAPSSSGILVVIGLATLGAGVLYCAKVARDDAERADEEHARGLEDEDDEDDQDDDQDERPPSRAALAQGPSSAPWWARDRDVWHRAEHDAGPGAPVRIVATIYESLGGRVAA
jgi:hypothetical protein